MAVSVSLSQVEGALERARQDAEEAHRRVVALEKIAEGLRELNGHAADLLGYQATQYVLPIEKPAHPRGREAVRLVTGERPGVWSLGELREELKARGWFTSPKAVEVAVRRLVASGEARSTSESGRYLFINRKEGAIESDASGGAMIPFPAA